MLAEEIKKEFNKRIFEESYPRIKHCLELIDEKQLWFKANSNSNSIANLILHLLGNMEQWICTSFGSKEDLRKRSYEFEAVESHTKDELILAMDELRVKVEAIIASIDEKDLLSSYNVQVYEELGSSIIIHVIEHFSYHTGQIAILTKLLADKDLEFYPYRLE